MDRNLLAHVAYEKRQVLPQKGRRRAGPPLPEEGEVPEQPSLKALEPASRQEPRPPYA